jgi:hypothetical protein
MMIIVSDFYKDEAKAIEKASLKDEICKNETETTSAGSALMLLHEWIKNICFFLII